MGGRKGHYMPLPDGVILRPLSRRVLTCAMLGLVRPLSSAGDRSGPLLSR